MTHADAPSPSVSSRLLRIVAILMAHALALLFVMVVLSKVVPIYALFFAQENVAIPAVTRQIVSFSEYCLVYFFPLFIFAMVADAAVVFSLAFMAFRKSWLLSAYSHVWLLAASAVLLYVSAWLSHPVNSLIR